MKIAVIKLGSRIAIGSSGTSGGTGEALSVIQCLTTADAEVTAYTKVLSKDSASSTFLVKDLIDNFDDINKNDVLVVLNGNVTYFGGQDDPYQTNNYKVINHFKGKVFYILCDINLVLKQIWNSIEKKEWADKYRKQCDAILEVLRRVGEENGAYVETEDLLSNNQKNGNGDDIHFCRESLQILGKRYFEAYRRLAAKREIAGS